MQAKITAEILIQTLNERYATKRFSQQAIDQTDLEALQESLRLAPSSFGLQPWKFKLVGSDPTLREKLRSMAFNQPQVTEAAEIVLICAHNDIVASECVDAHIGNTARLRNLPREALAEYENRINGYVTAMDAESRRTWADKQGYIALGFLIEAAALLGIDSCAIEGLQKDAWIEALGVDSKQYHAVVACALGYRSEEDAYATAKKSRFNRSDVWI